MKMMVVDDNKDIVVTLKSIMEKNGFSVTTADCGAEFLSKVTKDVGIVLLDVMMPGLTTKEILDELHKRKLDSIKIILVTVVRFSEEEQKKMMKSSNVVDYIPKPFDVMDIVKRVKKHMPHKKA